MNSKYTALYRQKSICTLINRAAVAGAAALLLFSSPQQADARASSDAKQTSGQVLPVSVDDNQQPFVWTS